MGLVAKILGVDNQPKGYYETHKNFYQPAPEVERLVQAKDAPCYRVTKLTARTYLGWIGSCGGVVCAGAAFFSLVALWKKNEKFEQEIAVPVRAFFKKQI
eukprot:GFUD01015700.1.p1 GENE.GFUD01015700.1~~GFUD01015700.1.p1  ORF type:complete len:100 (-),score=16.68 GFUD01015700.1:56-355(-)